MTQLARSLVLAGGMFALVVAGGSAVAPAQDKKDVKKDAKAEKDIKAGTVEVYKDKGGDFRFRVKDADGKVIAIPPKGYNSKEECVKALDAIRHTLNTAKVAEVKDDKKGDK